MAAVSVGRWCNDDNMKVACMTYNINGRRVNGQSFHALLSEECFNDADFIFIGFQEFPHIELFSKQLSGQSWIGVTSDWMRRHHKMLLYKTYLATNVVLIYARLDVFIAVERINYRVSRTTLGGLTGHKGSISVRIKLKNGDGLVFISSHFVAHPEKYFRRCLQFNGSNHCTFTDEQMPSTSYSTVWLGDMNWRVESLSPEEMVTKLEAIKDRREFEDFVNSVDQLRKAQKHGEAFADYAEHPITFKPTYRLMVGSKDYDLLRVPSWCDRILYKGSGIICQAYHSNEDIILSDHRPVIGIYTIKFSSSIFFWNVNFAKLPPWSSVVQIFCRFLIMDKYWNKDGSYRDWIGVYDVEMTDPTMPLHWIYWFSCYRNNEENSSDGLVYPFTAEFPCLPPGRYRFGYYSWKLATLQGISAPFSVSPSS